MSQTSLTSDYTHVELWFSSAHSTTVIIHITCITAGNIHTGAAGANTNSEWENFPKSFKCVNHEIQWQKSTQFGVEQWLSSDKIRKVPILLL